MRCSTARLLVSRDLDGRLGPAERESLAGHLGGCAACRESRRAMDSAWSLLETLPPPPHSPELFLRIEARAGSPAGPGALLDRLFPFLRQLATAAALGLVAVAGVAGGSLLSQGLSPRDRTGSVEAVALAEAFADVPPGMPLADFLGGGR